MLSSRISRILPFTLTLCGLVLFSGWTGGGCGDVEPGIPPQPSGCRSDDDCARTHYCKGAVKTLPAPRPQHDDEPGEGDDDSVYGTKRQNCMAEPGYPTPSRGVCVPRERRCRQDSDCRSDEQCNIEDVPSVPGRRPAKPAPPQATDAGNAEPSATMPPKRGEGDDETEEDDVRDHRTKHKAKPSKRKHRRGRRQKRRARGICRPRPRRVRCSSNRDCRRGQRCVLVHSTEPAPAPRKATPSTDEKSNPARGNTHSIDAGAATRCGGPTTRCAVPPMPPKKPVGYCVDNKPRPVPPTCTTTHDKNGVTRTRCSSTGSSSKLGQATDGSGHTSTAP